MPRDMKRATAVVDQVLEYKSELGEARLAGREIMNGMRDEAACVKFEALT